MLSEHYSHVASSTSLVAFLIVESVVILHLLAHLVVLLNRVVTP